MTRDRETSMDMYKHAVFVQDLTKIFMDFWRRPKVRAVDSLSLQIGRGQIFGLLGPNGSGKSTTLKILLGLLYPTSGTVQVLSESPRSVSLKKRIGYLPEESYLYGYLTARETLNFFGTLFDMKRSERAERVAELLTLVGLQNDADRPVSEFSKGMSRRLGLAQALINDPALLILDEPTVGLDPMGCHDVKVLMGKLAGQGKTILLTSHLLADVEDVCDRVAILYKGRVRAEGPLNDLLEKPDAISVTFPSVSSTVMREILELIRKHTGGDVDVRHPSMNLEEFFIRIIQEVHASPEHAAGRDTGSTNA